MVTCKMGLCGIWGITGQIADMGHRRNLTSVIQVTVISSSTKPKVVTAFNDMK